MSLKCNAPSRKAQTLRGLKEGWRLQKQRAWRGLGSHNHWLAAWQICFWLSDQDMVIYGAHAATFLVRYVLCWFPGVPVCPLLGWLLVLGRAGGCNGALFAAHMMGSDVWANQLHCRGSSCSQGQQRCFFEVSPIDSTRGHVSMVTCRAHGLYLWAVAVHSKAWGKGLISNNREFIFSWAKVTRGKTRTLKEKV